MLRNSGDIQSQENKNVSYQVLGNLPDPLILYIASFLEFPEIAKLAFTSKTMWNILIATPLYTQQPNDHTPTELSLKKSTYAEVVRMLDFRSHITQKIENSKSAIANYQAVEIVAEHSGRDSYVVDGPNCAKFSCLFGSSLFNAFVWVEVANLLKASTLCMGLAGGGGIATVGLGYLGIRWFSRHQQKNEAANLTEQQSLLASAPTPELRMNIPI